MPIPLRIRSQPGIQRDGSRFDSPFYVDGEWCRFQRGLPRKIGGYRRLTNEIGGIARQFHTQAENRLVYTHVGHSEGIERFTIDQSGNASAPADRTPAGFVANPNLNWSFDAMRDAAGSGQMALLAHASQTMSDISDGTNLPVYIGDVYGTAPLTPIGESVCGGLVVLHPFLFIFCKNGFVKWSDANEPTDFSTGGGSLSGSANIDAAKVVKGLPVRGGGQAPAGLFWTLNSLVRASFVGGDGVFAFDTVTASTSVLSANSIIEYDGVFYWCSLDRFSFYNGVVRDLPNNMNTNFFYDNLNYAAQNKVFAFSVPRFGEIWWCFPKGSATECNHAVIFNVREGTWYDTPLPDGGRSAGIYAQVFRSPLLAGTQPIAIPAGETRITEADDTRITEDSDERITDTGRETYKIWRHEVGTDAIDGSSVQAVRSFFETGDLSLMQSEPPSSRAISISAVEPDFVQSGDMTVQVRGFQNSKATDVPSAVKSFPAAAATPAAEVVNFKETRRLLRLRFESNTVGGDYQMGNTIAHIDPAGDRLKS